jgi:hypothetical protein
MKLRIAVAAALLTTACAPNVDLTSALAIESVSTGWANAGNIDSHNRIVPSVSFKLKNLTDRKLRTLEINALFRRVTEPQEWGSGFKAATGSEGLAPGAETPTITVKSSIGYTGTDGTDELLTNSQFVDARVELFAKNGSSSWTRIGEYTVSRVLLAP